MLKLEPIKGGIPDDLRALNPDFSKKVIVIGKDAYHMYPLTEGDLEDFSAEIMELLGSLAEEFIKRQEEGANEEETLQSVKDATRQMLDTGFIARLITKMTGLTEDQVRKEVTIPQLMHVAGTVFEINFDTKNYPELTRGKVSALMDFLGIGKRGATAFADDVLQIIFDPTINSVNSLRRSIFSSATRYLPSERWSLLSPASSAWLPKTSGDDDEQPADSPATTAAPTSPPAASAESPDASTSEGTTLTER